jgi:hypothetical protein
MENKLRVDTLNATAATRMDITNCTGELGFDIK